MREIVTHGLRLNAVTLHTIVGVLDQRLTGDVFIFKIAQPGFADGLKSGPLGLTQRPEFFVIL
ncbi:hypothetical protein D3C80_2157100 [compost metagenome]